MMEAEFKGNFSKLRKPADVRVSLNPTQVTYKEDPT